MPTLEEDAEEVRLEEELDDLRQEKEQLKISLFQSHLERQKLEDENKRLVDRTRIVRIKFHRALQSVTESLISALIDIDEDA